jgi:ketosteroid isomerase-like protein
MLSACVPEKVDEVAVEAEVSERLEGFVAALNAGNTKELLDYYSRSPRFYWVEDGQVTYPDYATLAGSLEGLYASLQSAEMSVLERRIDVLDAQSAMIYTEYEQDLTMKGGYGFSINGAMTVLMEKEEGTWRYIIGHSSTKKIRGG